MNAEEAKAYLNANPGALIYDRDGASWGRDGAQVHTPSGPNSEEWGPFQKEKPGGNESDIQSPAAGRKEAWMNVEEAEEYLKKNPDKTVWDRSGDTWALDESVNADCFVSLEDDDRKTMRDYAPFTVADPDAPSPSPSPSPSPAAGRKGDTGKPRISLLPADVLREVIAVFEHGAAKYGDDNWRGVEPAERYRDASFRHAHLERGPDPDSGIDALAHGIASLMILRARQLEAGK